MGTNTQEPTSLAFLKGGGEMGKLTRNHDWSQSSLGKPATWPHSLRIHLNLLLNSKFPMLLFWGPELINFYNDAFLPSLGNEGKHPSILGMPAQEAWSEVWEFTGPLVNEILKDGEAVWFEDQLVPIYRNGRMEEVYWTFSYSPVFDDGGVRNGVFVICTETTKSVLALQQLTTASQRLAESETRFRNIVDEAPVAIAIFRGPEYIIELANQEVLGLWGRTAEQVIGKPLFDVLPEAKGKGYEELLHNVQTNGTPFHAKELSAPLMRSGTLETVYFNFVYQPLREPDETITGVSVAAIEITEQVTARHKIQESEARLGLLSNTVPAMIFYLDREQRYQSYNETFMHWFGVNETEAIGKTVQEFIGEAAYEKVAPHLAKAYAGEQENYELEAPSKIAGAKWLNIVYTPHTAEDGTVLGLIVLATDITEIKQMETVSRQREEDLRNLVLQAPVGVCLVDAVTLVSEIVNDTFVEIAGKPYEAIMGKHYWQAFAEAAPYYEATLQGVIDQGKAFYASEVKLKLIRHGKEETIYVTFVYEPMKGADGSVKKVVIWILENTVQVTARQHIENLVEQRTAELAEANLLLKQNNQELEQFAYIASHDLQEPLRKVITFGQMLKSHLGEVDERASSYFEKISSATVRMMELIRDVLDFSQLSSQRQVFEQVDVQNILQVVAADYELLIEQKKAVIECGHLPTLRANALQMRQLFTNLLSNALKFSAEGKPPVISITSQPLSDEEKADHKDLLPEVDYCLITVADNGIGFGEEHAQKIFSIFQRLHGKSEFAGTGIGLAICKKIAQNHHGEIWATSQPGNGATFHIILPCPKQL